MVVGTELMGKDRSVCARACARAYVSATRHVEDTVQFGDRLK